MPEPYQPRLDPDEVARLRRWHERADAAIRDEADGTRVVAHLGSSFVVLETVHPITGMSDLLGRAVLAEVRADDLVLDMGTGCGVNAVLAARTATSVLAVDVNPAAIAATVDNAARNAVVVEARVSDAWAAVDGRFDLVVFDPPFRWFRPRDLLEAATTDEDYAVLGRFVAGLNDHLSDRGRALLHFGTSGDLEHVLSVVADAGFDVTELASRTTQRDDVVVSYCVYRLTRAG